MALGLKWQEHLSSVAGGRGEVVRCLLHVPPGEKGAATQGECVGGAKLPPTACLLSIRRRETHLQGGVSGEMSVKGKQERGVLRILREGQKKGPLQKASGRVCGRCPTTYLPVSFLSIQFAETLIFNGRTARGKG